MEHEKEPSSSSQSSFWLQALLLCLPLGVWLLSKFRAPDKQSIDSTDRSNSTNYGAEYPRDNPPRRISATETNGPPSAPECRYPEKKTKQWWKRWKVWTFALNIATFIAVVAYARITYNEWTEMQEQTRIQRKAGINAERAWVGLDGPPGVEVGSLERGKFRATIKLAVKNDGKGPALKVMANGSIVTSHVDDNVQSNCNLIFPFVGLKPSRPVSSDEDFPKHQWGHLLFTNQVLTLEQNIETTPLT